jgi:hypothetical protein
MINRSAYMLGSSFLLIHHHNKVECHHPTITDEDEMCKLVKWVEDRIVRHYEVEEREGLRTPGPAWAPAFTKVIKLMSAGLAFGIFVTKFMGRISSHLTSFLVAPSIVIIWKARPW